MSASKYISIFADDLEAMLSYRDALGFSKRTYENALLNFDRYVVTHYPDAITLSREIVTGWINGHLEKSWYGISNKATAVRLLGKYLTAIGKEAYILPDEYVTKPKSTFTPYIFTDDELTRLFYAIDRLPKSSSNPLTSKVPPVLFRLIYTCGIRPNEGRTLRRENINLKTGEIYITKTKRMKDRIVVMSDDMLGLCKKYSAALNALDIKSEYFFPCMDGQAYSELRLDRLFKSCWEEANPTVPYKTLPTVRIYDLRHRFASEVLNRWLDEKQNLYNKLPYLQAYMGHGKISDTVYYIHILPEKIVKSAGVDWDALEAMIPLPTEGAESWQS